MIKKLAVGVAILALGLAAGWWVRERIAIDACLDMGGKWSPWWVCYGATSYRFD